MVEVKGEEVQEKKRGEMDEKGVGEKNLERRMMREKIQYTKTARTHNKDDKYITHY